MPEKAVEEYCGITDCALHSRREGMADLKMVLEKTNDLKSKIDSVLRYSTYDKCDDLGDLEIN